LNQHRYWYDAECLRVVDGDTVKLKVSLGLDSYIHITSRVFGINAPEMRGAQRKEGIKSKAALQSMIDLSEGLVVQTIRDKTGKYGRYLVHLWDDHGQNLGDELVNMGMAVRTDYG